MGLPLGFGTGGRHPVAGFRLSPPHTRTRPSSSGIRRLELPATKRQYRAGPTAARPLVGGMNQLDFSIDDSSEATGASWRGHPEPPGRNTQTPPFTWTENAVCVLPLAGLLPGACEHDQLQQRARTEQRAASPAAHRTTGDTTDTCWGGDRHSEDGME